MSIQHLNDAKTIARAADQLGVTLPERISRALAHIEDLTRNTPAAPRPGHIAAELAAHIGDPAKMEKALKAAAASLATAQATAQIHAYLTASCGTRVREMMKGQTEQIAAAFGAALSSDLDQLNATAGRLPEWFTEYQAGSLDPETFKAWSRARDANARIQFASSALAPLYSGYVDSINFAVAAAASLRFAKSGEFTEARDAYAFRDALAGRTKRVQGLAGQGSTFVNGLFIPTVLAYTGATFEWATPAEVQRRADHVTTASSTSTASGRSRDHARGGGWTPDRGRACPTSALDHFHTQSPQTERATGGVRDDL